MITKSPFYIASNFVSPQTCEDLIDGCNFTVPDMDSENKAVLTHKTTDYSQQIVYDRMQDHMPKLEEYYSFTYKGMKEVRFEWYPEGVEGNLSCENSVYLRKKWLRTQNRDFTAILFLKDYQDVPPLDIDFEMYGGKLEFPQHQFGFNPKRGTLIVFPSDPHFINKTTQIIAGDLHQARIHITATNPYMYDPSKFPGTYQNWFK